MVEAEEDDQEEVLEAELRGLEEGEEEDPPLSWASMYPARAETSGGPAERIEVVVRHATEGGQVRISLPKHAKFKHIKKAVAARLGEEDVLRNGLLTCKLGGRYRACKDQSYIRDVRHVLVANVDLGGEELEAALSDGAVSVEDFAVEMEAGASASSSSQAPKPSSTLRGARPGHPKLTLDQAICLQRELLAAFQEKKFQDRLDSLDRIYGAIPNSLEFVQERQELFLSVQSVILPRYGFEGSLAGVYRMMGAMGEFIEDPEFARLAKDINRLLGVRSPPSTWGKLSKECQQLDVDASDPDGSKAAAAKRRQRPDMDRQVPPPADGVAAPRSLLLPLVPPYAKEPAAAAPKADRRVHGSEGGPVQATAKEGALPFEPWPASRARPFKLFVAGTWNNYKPSEMHWQQGLFVSPVTLGPTGKESFQLLKNGQWRATLYPSVPDASPLIEHGVCGPDEQGHGRNWTIGQHVEEEAAPGRQFAIIAALDKQGSVQLVHWQHM